MKSELVANDRTLLQVAEPVLQKHHNFEAKAPNVRAKLEDDTLAVSELERSHLQNDEPPSATAPIAKGWRFWAIFPALCLASLLTALDATVMSTALPTISADLDSSSSYIWAVNAYTLSITAIQPVYGQIANAFGRKWTLVGSFIIFMLGSGVCGGAHSMAMLIAGRTVQGIGGAGLNILPAMVVCDLVPLRDRQLYQSLIYAAFAMGTFIGPLVGGALTSDWHWIFFMNLPICACALLLTLLFLQLNAGKEQGVLGRLRRIDYPGNVIFTGAITSVLIALSDTTTPTQWRSWPILVPFFVGIFGLVLFVCWNSSRFCHDPIIPARFFANKTSAAAFAVTFLHGVVLYWSSYFLPVYFQAVRLATPLRSGVNTLAGVVPMVPFGIVGAVLISRTNRLRENQAVGFALIAIAVGCYSTLDEHSPTAVWVILQIIGAAGAGFILTATLPSIQAPLPESDVAASTATWGFIQSLGFVCGAAIPSNIFNTRFQQLLLVQVANTNDDNNNNNGGSNIQKTLSDGSAYEHATRSFLLSLDEITRQTVIDVFAQTLKLVWQVEIAFAALGFVISLLIRNVALRDSLETEYGYKDREGVRGDGGGGGGGGDDEKAIERA